MSDQELPVSDLLAARRIADAGPDFWADIEAQLATESSPLVDAARLVPAHDVDTEVDTGDSDIDELQRRRIRRWLIVTAAAAAIVAIIFGVNALTEDTGPAPVVTDITTTTSTAPRDEDAAPDQAGDLARPLEWSDENTNLSIGGNFDGNFDGNVVVRLAEDGFYALGVSLADNRTPSIGEGLMRSDDGVAWEPVDVSGMRVGTVSPSWAGDGSVTEFVPAALEVNGASLHVVEITTLNVIPPRARIWSSRAGGDWSMVEVTLSGAPPPPVDIEVVFDAGGSWTAASPTALVVALRLRYDVDWWQFDPGDWDPDETRRAPEVLSETFFEAWPVPGPDGITFSPLPADPSLVDLPPLVPWEELRPEARQTYEWLLANDESDETLYVLGAGDDAPQTVEPLEAPSNVGFIGGGLYWTGTRFVDLRQGGVAVSDDGLTWEFAGQFSADRFPNGVNVAAVLDDALVTWGGLAGEEDVLKLMVSTDLGRTFELVEIDLPDWGRESGQWTPINIFDSILSPAAGSVQEGVATLVVSRITPGTTQTLEVVLLRSTNGVDWSASPVDAVPDPNMFSASMAAVITSDGTTLIYGLHGISGKVDIGRPLD